MPSMIKPCLAAAVVSVVGLLLILSPVLAGGKPDRAHATAMPLEARIVAKQDTYTLDPGRQGQQFRDALQVAERLGSVTVKPPGVKLTLQLTNTGQQALTVWIGSDRGRVDLELNGPGAVSLRARQRFTKEFRVGKPVKIAAGKTHELPLDSLEYGFRGVEHHAYWTEPGEYTLRAHLTLATDRQGAATLKTSTPALKLKVVDRAK